MAELIFALIERDAKQCAFLHRETYAEWIRRFCAERKIPWRPEYAIPMDERPHVARRKVGA